MQIVSVASCKAPRYVPVEVPLIVSEVEQRADTLIVRDSVLVDRWRDADTVYVDRVRLRTVERVKERVKERVDTVTVVRPVEVVKKVGTGIPFWWLLVMLFVGMLLSFLIRVLWRLMRK